MLERGVMKKGLVLLVVLPAFLYGAYTLTAKYQNQRPSPDLYYDVYLNQDTVPEGRVAVFLVGLSMAEDYEPFWWNNIFEHVRRVVIPWPGRFFAGLDRDFVGKRILPYVIVILLLLTGYFFSYIISPHDLRWQMSSSLFRLLVHIWPLFVFLFFYSAKRLENS